MALGEEFARRGHAVTHFSRRFAGLPDYEVLHGVRHRRLVSRDAPKSKFWYRALDVLYSQRVFRALSPDCQIVISGSLWLPIFMRGRNARRLYVHVARLPKGQMRFYQHAARLQAVSRVVAMAIEREIPKAKNRISIVPPCLSNDPPVALNNEEVRHRDRRILYLGRIHPEKGIHLLLEAFAMLNLPDWELELVGSPLEKHGGGGEEYFEGLRELAKLTPGKVKFSGMIEQQEINGRFRSAAVMVYPSVAEKGESFGMAPLEAMSCGTPAIVSNLDCFKDYLIEGCNGLAFDHRIDPVGNLSRTIKRFVTDEPFRQEVAWSGYQTSREFTVERVADRYLVDFEKLLQEQGRG